MCVCIFNAANKTNCFTIFFLFSSWFDDFALGMKICQVMPSVRMKSEPNFSTWKHIMLRKFQHCGWIFFLLRVKIINCFFCCHLMKSHEMNKEKEIKKTYRLFLVCFVRVFSWLHQFWLYLRMVVSFFFLNVFWSSDFWRWCKPQTKTSMSVDFFSSFSFGKSQSSMDLCFAAASAVVVSCRQNICILFVLSHTIYDVK